MAVVEVMDMDMEVTRVDMVEDMKEDIMQETITSQDMDTDIMKAKQQDIMVVITIMASSSMKNGENVVGTRANVADIMEVTVVGNTSTNTLDTTVDAITITAITMAVITAAMTVVITDVVVVVVVAVMVVVMAAVMAVMALVMAVMVVVMAVMAVMVVVADVGAVAVMAWVMVVMEESVTVVTGD